MVVWAPQTNLFCTYIRRSCLYAFIFLRWRIKNSTFAALMSELIAENCLKWFGDGDSPWNSTRWCCGQPQNRTRMNNACRTHLRLAEVCHVFIIGGDRIPAWSTGDSGPRIAEAAWALTAALWFDRIANMVSVVKNSQPTSP